MCTERSRAFLLSPIYKAPEEAYAEDDITQIVSIDTQQPREAVIDLRTNTFSISNIDTDFSAAVTAQIKTIDVHDYEGAKQGVRLRWPNTAQRTAWDQELRDSRCDIKQCRRTTAAANAAVMSVRDIRGDLLFQIPVLITEANTSGTFTRPRY